MAKDLEAVHSGDPAALKRVANRTSAILLRKDGEPVALDPESRQKLVEEQARIERLRERIKMTNAELLPEIAGVDGKNELYRGKDLKRMTNEYVDSVVDKNKDNPKRLAQELGVIRSQLEGEVRPGSSGLRSALPKDRAQRVPAPGGLSQLPGYSPSAVRLGPPKLLANKPKVITVLPRASQLPVPQVEEAKPAPAPQVQSQAPAISAIPGAYSNVYPPWMSGYQQQAPVDPLLMQNLTEIKDKIGKAMEKNESLEQELKRLQETPQADEPTPAPNPRSKPPTAKRETRDLPAPEGRFALIQILP